MENTKQLFESKLLNEQFELGNIGTPSIIKKKAHELLEGINGDSIVVEVFPEETFYDNYDKGLKNKILYRLKKEGFKFTSFSGVMGCYIKPI